MVPTDLPDPAALEALRAENARRARETEEARARLLRLEAVSAALAAAPPRITAPRLAPSAPTPTARHAQRRIVLLAVATTLGGSLLAATLVLLARPTVAAPRSPEAVFGLVSPASAGALPSGPAHTTR